MNKHLVLTRNVTITECDWLARDMKAGEVVFPYRGCTYGCITPSGRAVSLNGDMPFFELPEDALSAP